MKQALKKKNKKNLLEREAIANIVRNKNKIEEKTNMLSKKYNKLRYEPSQKEKWVVEKNRYDIKKSEEYSLLPECRQVDKESIVKNIN